jgi:DNA-binding response OmpR family regulator
VDVAELGLGEPIEIAELRIEPRQVEAFVDGSPAKLTVTEFKLLYLLASELGRPVTRDELIERIWGRRVGYRDRRIDVFVQRLRKKLDAAGATNTFVQTHIGVGYRFEPEPRKQGASTVGLTG